MNLSKTAFLFLCSVCVFSASAQKEIDNSPFSKIEVKITSIKSPQMNFEVDSKSEKALKTSKESQRVIKDWLNAVVQFNVKSSKDGKWPKWLDNVSVELMIFIPGVSKAGKNGLIVLHGKQILNPVQADDKTHFVRFFIPPYLLSRYYDTSSGSKVSGSEKSRSKAGSAIYRKEAVTLPAHAVVSYGSYKFWGVQKAGKKFLERLGNYSSASAFIDLLTSTKINNENRRIHELYSYVNDNRMNAKNFIFIEDSLWEADRTPFFALEFDKYESTINDKRSR